MSEQDQDLEQTAGEAVEDEDAIERVKDDADFEGHRFTVGEAPSASANTREKQTTE